MALFVCALLLLFGLVDAASAQGLSFGPRQSTALSPSAGFFGWIFSQQAAFYRSLSNLIRDSKNNGSAVWGLFGLSFLYGIFHAAGPGHGKSVISSYLVANNETWRRGVALSFVSAMLQSVVAVAIVAIGAGLLEVTAKAMGDTVRIIEIVSYCLVVFIGLRLFWVKGRSFVRSYHEFTRPKSLGAAAAEPVELRISDAPSLSDSCSCGHHHHGHHHHDHPHQHADHPSEQNVHDHHHHDHCDHDHASAWGHSHGPEPQELAGPGGWRRGLTAVLAVGARPCSGAIIVLVFALSQDLFWTGVGATFLMGVGTAITVAAIATLAVCARSLASRLASSRSGSGMLAMKGIEVGAAALIVVVGVLLLTGYMASEKLWMFSA
ncbi:nickel/cobalt transporter (plasmid) [Nitrobacteraceae bacterium UC4446_H13]